MKIVVSQPMYLPWPGLFNQIKLADVFVHFDDVQLPQGRSFVSRVQVKTKSGIQWLTVPLKRSTRGIIKNVEMDHSKTWHNNHLNLIEESLKGTPFFCDIWPILNSAFSQNFQYLADFNIFLLEQISQYLGMNTQFKRSSSFNVEGASSERLLKIVQRLGGNVYITGHGARNYLDHKIFEQANVDVQYMNYQIKEYDQGDDDFTPFVTILDMIARKGSSSLHHLESTAIFWKEFICNG